MNAIEVKNLTKNYKGFTLNNISFDLPSGCIMGLIGENGAGKSTTIRSILGMIKPDNGNISVLGKKLTAKTKEDIGVVLDEVGIPAVFNVNDINTIMKKMYKNWDETQFFDYIKAFSLPKDKKFDEFSKGMKMKLGIAIALSHKAKLLILDEPTSGLDPLVRDEIIDILNDFTRDDDHSILISSHIVSDLEKLCDYIAFIHQGELLFCEEKDQLLEQYGIFEDSRENLDCLLPEAVVAREETRYGGVRALIKRELAPAGFRLEKPTVEDVVLFLVKGAKAR